MGSWLIYFYNVEEEERYSWFL